MRVLVACEYSGRVREAFLKRGHEAISCDLLPAEDGSTAHVQGKVEDLLGSGWWDLMIAHPPCTDLSVSGSRYWAAKQADGRQQAALAFVQMLMGAPVAKICIENPVGKISTAIRKPDQIIQPWQFGEPYSKATCLWLKGLPPLVPTNMLTREGRWKNQTPSGQNNLGPSPDRWKERSRTYQGIADAFAAQWG